MHLTPPPVGAFVSLQGALDRLMGRTHERAREAPMSKIRPFLWFENEAEEAAGLYTSIFPDSHVDRVTRSPADNPSTKAGDVLTVEFTLAGEPFVALNGGPGFPFSEAISF